MRIIVAGAIGSAVAFLLVYVLATEHRIDAVPMDVQVAVGSAITGCLSFAGGWLEHRRSRHRAEREEQELRRIREGGGSGEQ